MIGRLYHRLRRLLTSHQPSPRAPATPGFRTHPRLDEWKSYPRDAGRHTDHDTARTAARYGRFRVWYCYDCGRHYREVWHDE